MSPLFDRAPLSAHGQPRLTRPLSEHADVAETPTAPLPRMTRPLTGKTMTTRPLVYIPATEKRLRTTDKLATKPRRTRVMISACVGILLMALLAVFLVAPLNNGQQSFGLAQTINNWFTHQAPGIINPAQQYTTIPTPALNTDEGYCGGTDIWGTCATWITASGVMGTGQMQRPILGAVITQPFAHPEFQDWCGCWKPHSGIDLAAPFGAPIMAADSGQVIWTGWDWSGLGWAVKINHGHYIATIYGHMEKFIVHVGENVTKGQVIGYEGSTGQSTGPHVHFMVMVNNIWVNPQLFVQLP
jgi:murein DD-endopeptidase MepM/ murein hydrolase activator NlpD